MKSLAAKISATLILMLVIGVAAMVSPLKNAGYELSGGWTPKLAACPTNKMAITGVKVAGEGFPLTITRPILGGVGPECQNQENTVAKSFNFAIYLTLSAAIVWGVSGRNNQRKKGHDEATTT